MELLKSRRSKKLNNQYRHVYSNMMGGSKESGTGPWVAIYNRMIKDLLFDLQDGGCFPSNAYLHEQMSQIKNQAKKISSRGNEPQEHEVKWDRIISAVQDSDFFWDNEVHIRDRYFYTKCFALISERGLSSSELITIESILGGSYLNDHGVIHVNCVNVLRRDPLDENMQVKYDRVVKHLLLDNIKMEMKSMGEETMLLTDKRSPLEKAYDWYLKKVL